MEKISIAVIGTILGASINYISFRRNKEKEIRSESSGVAKSIAKLDYISKGVDDLRLDFKDQARTINGINDRLIRAEESVKSAHKRIDKIEQIEKGEM